LLREACRSEIASYPATMQREPASPSLALLGSLMAFHMPSFGLRANTGPHRFYPARAVEEFARRTSFLRCSKWRQGQGEGLLLI
jgi:hypothetical protein